MEVNEFNSLFLNTLSENLLSEKNKEIVLLGDFNIDLLKYEKDHNTADFLDQMYSASLAPHITSPTRITSHSRTLIVIDKYLFNGHIRKCNFWKHCSINL